MLDSLIFRRLPSLRGHHDSKRLFRARDLDIYRITERHTLLEKQLVLVRTKRSSVGVIYAWLTDSGIAFEALSLRNGTVCFVLGAGTITNGSIFSSRGWLGNGEDLSPKLLNQRRVLFWFVGAAVLMGLIVLLLNSSGLSVSGYEAEPPSSSVAAPSASALTADTCDEQMADAQKVIRAFLESGKSPASLVLERISSTKIGGLQSIRVSATCSLENGAIDQKVRSSFWRVTLSLSDEVWQVKKMTRLDN